MNERARPILSRHRRRLHGRLRARRLRSEALGLPKPYYVYEPPGLEEVARGLPVCYLFRGHEREWVNMEEDDSRERSTAIEDLDRAIQKGALPPMLVVMPGLNSDDNRIPSLGIDMAGTWPKRTRGLGTGRFWTYLTDELIPAIDARYVQIESGPRLMAGFSLGGYTVSLLALKRPGDFHHAAIYDGLFMWPDHRDPRRTRRGPCTDRVWCRASIFDPAFGDPRDPQAMARWNPTDDLCEAGEPLREAMQQTTFWIACAAGEGNRGNRDRARFFVWLLRQQGCRLGSNPIDVALHPDAAHSWHWADRFLMRFLAGVFGECDGATSAQDALAQLSDRR